jgi:hypothetical protein
VSTCATASRALNEPLAATAATARTWLLLEQPGPWGPKALTGSRLDPALGRALDAAASPHGVRLALIRRPGPHADRGGAPRRVHLAHTLPGRSWSRTLETTDPAADLAGLDFTALGAGDATALAPGWRPHGTPLVAVCTNGRRDRCCAVLGRPLAAELAAAGDADVWEITHLGGHRFSPTVLVLPHGYAYGRVGAHTVKDVLAAAARGEVVTDSARGRSSWERPGQAADLAVREHTGERGADALDVVRIESAAAGGDRWAVTVTHADGRSFLVRVAAAAGDASAPASCGADPGLPPVMKVEAVTEYEPDRAAAARPRG